MSPRDHLPVAALAGFFMAIALALGQLTRPEVIIGWVDFADWNPHMLVFFAAAATVYHLFARLHDRRQRRAGAAPSCPPLNQPIDGHLLLGSGIFGVGWAIAGTCPGPALTALGAGPPGTAVFVGAMAVGLLLARPRSR